MGQMVDVSATLKIRERDLNLLNAGWKQVENSYFDDDGKEGTGLTFSAYQKNNAAGVKEVVFVFGGTTAGKGDLKDVTTDFDILSPAGAPGQFEKAIANTNWWMAKIKAANPTAQVNFTATGHSLGGGLAQYVSIEKGINAVTFNSAPIPVLKPGWADENEQAAYKSRISAATTNGLILNISTNDDPLSQLMRYVFEEKPDESAVVTATNLVATSYVQVFGDIVASGLKSGALKEITGEGSTSDSGNINYANSNKDVDFLGLKIKNSAARQMQLALSDGILDVQEFKKVVLAQYGLTNTQHIPLVGDKLILYSGTGHSMAGLLDQNFSKLRGINPFEQLFFSGPNDNSAKGEVESQTLVASPEQIKAGIESLAKDQLAREKEIKEKEVALAATAKPDGNVEEMIARLVKLDTERDYLDYAEKAINGRTGGAQTVFDGMTGAEQSKIKFAAYKLYGLPTPTEADAIRLISEFYALNSNNRTALFDLDVGLTDKSTMPDTLARQNYNQEAIQNRINALKNGQVLLVDAGLAAELAGLKQTYDENKSTLGNMVSDYLKVNPQPDNNGQPVVVRDTSATIQTLGADQIMTTAASNRFQSGYSGNVSMVIGQGHTVSSGVGNADESTYLNYDFRNGMNMSLLLSGGVTVTNPLIETGTANHFNSGRFSTLGDAHYGNFSHAAWGMWQGTGPSFVDPGNGNILPVNRVYWTLGPQFHRNDLPASGYAYYNGPAIGDLHSGGQIMIGELVGDIGLRVALSDMDVSGTLSLYRQSNLAGWGSFSFSGPLEWPADGENLGFGHGTATMTGTGVTSSEIYGNFQGPNGTVRTPPEVSGGWELQKSNGEFGAGVWRAKEVAPVAMTAAHMSDSGRNNMSGLSYAAIPRNGVDAILKLKDDGPSGYNAYVSPEFTTGVHNHGHRGSTVKPGFSRFPN
jgi:hypothetical protein